MSAPSFESVIAEARRAMGDVGRWLDATFVGPTLQNLLDALRVSEAETLAARALLVQLRDMGLAQPTDFMLFDKLRASSYRAQIEVYSVLVALVNVAVPGGAVMLPQPRVVAAVPTTPRTNALALRGLGEPVEITLGASGFVALAIVALTALGVSYLLSEALINVTHQWAAVAVARAQAEQFKSMVTARLEAYRRCIDQGGDAASCGATAAETVPTPRDSGTELTPPGNPDPTPWIAVGVLSTLGVFALGGMGYFWARGRMRGGMGRVPLRTVAALPGRVADLDGSKSSYNLEIGGGLGGRKRGGR